MGATEIAKALKSGGPTGRLPTGPPLDGDDQSAEASTDCRLRGVRDLSRKACWAF
jgi:hypothetical protein